MNMKLQQIMTTIKDPDAVVGGFVGATGATGLTAQAFQLFEQINVVLSLVLSLGNIGLMIGGWFLLHRRLKKPKDGKDVKNVD